MINLVTQEFKQKTKKIRQEILFMQILVISLILAGLFSLGSYFLLNMWEARNKKILTKIVGDREEATKASHKIDSLNLLLGNLQERYKLYTQLSSRKILWYKKLIELQEVLPDEMWIRDFYFDISQGKLSLQASLINLTNKNLTSFLGKFVNDLKFTPFFKGFKEVLLSRVRRRTQEEFEIMDFNLDLILR